MKDYDLVINSISFTSKYMPALGIGGDFYDIVKINETFVGIIIGDVSGHGISAALLTSMLNMMFKNLIHKFTDTHTLLSNMNSQFYEIFRKSSNEMYACVFFAVLDTTKKIMYYSNAGHPLPLFYNYHENTIVELESYGVPIGMMENSVYDINSINYSDNDMLFLYTDGLSDTLYKDNTEEFLNIFKNIILANSVNVSNKDLIDMLLMNFYNYNLKPSEKLMLDDISLIVCRI